MHSLVNHTTAAAATTTAAAATTAAAGTTGAAAGTTTVAAPMRLHRNPRADLDLG